MVQNSDFLGFQKNWMRGRYNRSKLRTIESGALNLINLHLVA